MGLHEHYNEVTAVTAFTQILQRVTAVYTYYIKLHALHCDTQITMTSYTSGKLQTVQITHCKGVRLLGLLLTGSTGQHMAGRNGLA
jgi:hypothetical protein